jgi:signal peptidase II
MMASAVMAIVIAADLWTKEWAWNTLRDGESIEVIKHVFYFKFGFNTGSAFSFLRDVGWARSFFIFISGVALVYMGWLTLNMPTRKGYGFLAVGLIAGGAAGNLHDRFVRTMLMPLDGEMVERYGVIDFLQFFYDWDGQRYWPIFNVADSALVCGVFLFLLYIRAQSKEEEALAASAQEIQGAASTSAAQTQP